MNDRKALLIRDWGDGPERFWFAEVEPDLWLEINREPETVEDLETAKLIANGIDPETGEQRRTRPILAATRWLRMTADDLTIMGVEETEKETEPEIPNIPLPYIPTVEDRLAQDDGIGGIGWLPTPLPAEIGLPDIADVLADNDHDTGWELTDSADQGPQACEIDRYWARYTSDRGHLADYFYINGRWGLGAN